MDKKNLSFDKLKFYYGIPHAHTSLSTGKSSPMEALEYARNKGLDFLILTDHNKYLSENIRDKNKEISKWLYLNKCINKFNKKHSDFLALSGFEAKSTTLGHLNILCPNTFFKGIVSDINYLLLWLINDHNAILSINHPKNSIDKNIIFSPLLDKLLCSIEVGNGNSKGKYKRYDSQFFSLLDKGFKLSAINSQDNHKLDFGDNDNLTCVITHRLNKNSVLSAFKEHHVFSTESRSLKLLFSINSVFMGGTLIICPNDILRLYVQAEDIKNRISKIQFIVSGGEILKEINNIDLSDVKYIFECKSSPKITWIVTKIFLNGEKESLSSPIFINYE